MGRILVLFQSNSGNTARMAEMVAEGARQVDGVEVRLLGVDQATADDLKWCDGIALGSPTNLGCVSWKMKKWWDEVAAPVWMEVDGKIGCAFSSSGGWGGGSEIACQALMNILINFGFLVFGLTDYTGRKMTAHYGAVCGGEPRTDGELEACRRMGRRLAEWVAVYVDGRTDQHPLRQTYPREAQL
jgi:NAD(P)H dehydrogenase (quinone)